MSSSIDKHLQASVNTKLNAIANILHNRIRAVADKQDERAKAKLEKGEIKPVQSSANTDKDIKSIKAKIRDISSDMEYPFAQKDFYGKFLEIEDEFNDKLQTGSYEYFNRFNKLMVDFKEFVLVALGKMKKDNNAARARGQTVDILNDIEYYLKEGSFPDVSIAERAKNLAGKKSLSERASKIVKEGNTDAIVQSLADIAAFGGNVKEQLRLIRKKYQFLDAAEARALLDHFEVKNPLVHIGLPAPALPPVPGIALPALPPLPASATLPASAIAARGHRVRLAESGTDGDNNDAFRAPSVPATTRVRARRHDSGGVPAPAIVPVGDDIAQLLIHLRGKNFDYGKRNIKALVANEAYRYLEGKGKSRAQANEFYTNNNIFERTKPAAAAGAHGSGLGLLSGDKDQVYANKGAYDFSKDVQHTVKLLSFYNEFNAEDIKGSSSFRSMINNSDYDMFQQVYENKSFNQAVSDVTKKMQEVVKRLMKQKTLYIMDIKCGLDHELEFDFPALSDGKIVGYSQKKVTDFLTKSFTNKYISESQYKTGKELAKPKLSLEDYFELKDYLRKLKTLRWEPVDFVKGKQELPGGRTKNLLEAMSDKTLIKIDAISKVGTSNRLVEFSNIYEFWARDKPINAQELDYVKMIKDEIYMLYTFGKYAKMDKRILLLDRYYKKTERVEILTELFNGSLGILNKIKGDIEAIVALIEKFPSNLPWATILAGLDGMRERFANVFDINLKLEDINDSLLHLTKLTNTDKNREYMLVELETLMDYCGAILNRQALSFNKSHGLQPLPSEYK